MSTPQHILDQLTAAWGSAAAIHPAPIQAAPIHSKPIDLARAQAEPKHVTPAPVRLERPTPICSGHASPFDLIDERDPKRPSYIRSTCRACGRFVGYRRDDR